ncbi:hypothetical protein FVE67_08510 [Thermosulfurimonas marina]|uniref:GGDEF domain-containing protein n=1 Tax=Thermosulfurimonas marina TaxID=2047767 RepID=A0A6H1WUF1_9BACT|nr:hypothetical protein [Thermosulfurimonas marina]QJA06827.1 hypothetical protein FVE67_08510 [Thermosulfurimonas marina]
MNITEDGALPVGATFLPLNGYVPVFREEDRYDRRYLVGERGKSEGLSLIDQVEVGSPKTFHHLAQLALSQKDQDEFYGLPALATFKADVDNLGALFACGLPRKLFTLSRLSTMSRQLHNFFTVYLPYALAREAKGAFRNVYTVFAGGDDLFLIGPWTEIRDLALFLRHKFREYVCENSKIHFSAGIVLHKPYTPVDLLARKSEEALSSAKKDKNRVTMFGVVVPWEEFEELRKIEEKLEQWTEEGCLSRGSLYRLNELAFMAAEEICLLTRTQIPLSRLRCLKWRAFLRYFLVRQLERAKGCPQKYESLVFDLAQWLDTYREAFIIALWPLLYRTRKQRVKGGAYGLGGKDLERQSQRAD